MSSRFELLLEFRRPLDELGGKMLGILCQSVFVLFDSGPPLKKLWVQRGVEQIAQFRAEPHQGFAKVFSFPRVMAGQDFEMGGGVGQFFEYCVVTYRAQI